MTLRLYMQKQFSRLQCLKVLLVMIMVTSGTTAVATEKPDSSPVENWLHQPKPLYDKTHAPIQWKFAHPAPPVSLLPPIWRSGFKWLEVASSGRFLVKEYGSGSLYGYKGGVKAIRAGIADYGTCYSMAEAHGFELLNTFQVPYVAPSNPYLAARIINELMATRLKHEFLDRGVYPAHVVPVRPLTLMSKTPIKTPADLKGKKIVSFMKTPGADKLLGFAQVQIPFTDIYTSLQQGMVDAVIWVDMGFIPFKIYEQAKYYTEINVAPLTVDTCLNRKSFDKLPSGLKQIVYDFQQQIGITIVNKVEEYASNAKQLLKSQGVEFIRLSESDRSQWQQAFEPVVEQWLDRCEKKGKDCRGLIKDIEQLKQKYQSWSNQDLMRLAMEQPVKGIIEF